MEESIKPFLQFYKETLGLKDVDATMYSPLVLAYIGDGVYELIIRTVVINKGSIQVNKIHKHTSGLVCAPFQARMIKALEEELTEEEHAVFKRGRNAKSFTSAKNASITDYRFATGFEALIGWLFLSENYRRLTTLVQHGLEKLGEYQL